MSQKFANAARGVLASTIAPETTTIEISQGGDLFPVISGNDWFKAVLQDADGIEIIRVNARTGNVFTVVRGQEGTTARAFSVGTTVGLRITAADVEGSIATANNSVQLTGNQTIGGIKHFTSEIVASGGVQGNVTGNATTATALQTARTINGVSFNGTANITTNSWGTARTITIGSTGKSVDGSGNVSWTLAEIGAPAANSVINADGNYLVHDTRNVDTPTDLGEMGVRFDFKFNTADGLHDGGTYHTVMTIQNWGELSGGNTHQLGFSDFGNLWYRTAPIGGTWGAWRAQLNSANFNSFAPTLTGAGASGTWGINVTGNAATVTNGVYTTDTQTLTNKTLTSPAITGGTASDLTLNDGYTEEIFAVTGTTPALSPTNGSIQTWTLSGASTPTQGTWANGQSITLLIDDGTANTINWSSLGVVWKTNGGNAPTLLTTGLTVIQLWEVGDVIYGARVGDA